MIRIFSGIIVALLIGGFIYYKQTENIRSNNSVLRSNQSMLESINQENQTVIDSLQHEYAEIERKYHELQDEFTVMRMQRDELVDRFGKHDLELLARSKPGLVENIINESSNKVGRCFEVLTGLPKKPGEKNSECPWLFEGE